MLAFGPTGALEAEWSLTTFVTIVISVAHAHVIDDNHYQIHQNDVDAIIIILTILLVMTLMMIVALEVADKRVVAAINNVCRVTGQTNGFPLIRSNMGELGVWGCFGSFAFHSHFLPRSTNLVKYGGTWCVGVFRIFCFSLSLSIAFH